MKKTRTKSVVDLDADEYATLLRLIGACKEAVDWSQGKSLKEAWEACTNVMWLSVLACRLGLIEEKGDPSDAAWRFKNCYAYRSHIPAKDINAAAREYLQKNIGLAT